MVGAFTFADLALDWNGLTKPRAKEQFGPDAEVVRHGMGW